MAQQNIASDTTTTTTTTDDVDIDDQISHGLEKLFITNSSDVIGLSGSGVRVIMPDGTHLEKRFPVTDSDTDEFAVLRRLVKGWCKCSTEPEIVVSKIKDSLFNVFVKPTEKKRTVTGGVVKIHAHNSQPYRTNGTRIGAQQSGQVFPYTRIAHRLRLYVAPPTRNNVIEATPSHLSISDGSHISGVSDDEIVRRVYAIKPRPIIVAPITTAHNPYTNDECVLAIARGVAVWLNSLETMTSHTPVVAFIPKESIQCLKKSRDPVNSKVLSRQFYESHVAIVTNEDFGRESISYERQINGVTGTFQFTYRREGGFWRFTRFANREVSRTVSIGTFHARMVSGIKIFLVITEYEFTTTPLF